MPIQLSRGRLEQLDRIPVGIFDLDLLAGRAEFLHLAERAGDAVSVGERPPVADRRR
jgi:hypothetical protein